MKKGLLYLGMMVVALSFATGNVNAQAVDVVDFTLEEMATISATDGAGVLTLVAPLGGTKIADAFKEDSYINYTSIVAEGVTNEIRVGLSRAVPVGTTLTITATLPITGNGLRGSINTASFTSTAVAVLPLIKAIGSCYTGSEASDGAKLKYTWSVNTSEYAQVISAVIAPITATYTIVATGAI